ncbi:MAG: restriction endonuclease, partial [Afipia sp.]|nr:restriction endonuclease [Afipia sp.]
MLEHKRRLAEDMLNGAGDVGPGDFNIADVIPNADLHDIDTHVTLDTALRMDWQHLECLIAALWSRRGFVCNRTSARNDNGVDIVAIKDSKGELIQVKSSGIEGASIGWDAVKDVVTGEAFYRRQHPGIEFGKVCVTNQFFSTQAAENAVLNNVELLNQEHLAQLLTEHSVTMNELDRIRYT